MQRPPDLHRQRGIWNEHRALQQRWVCELECDVSRLTQIPKVGVDVAIKLTEAEMRALDALAGYGFKAFIEWFYKDMGTAYMKPHEAGLESLFNTIRSELPPILSRLDAAKKAFALKDPIIRSRQDHDELVKRITDQAKGTP
jgi:hypothetical protein